MTETTPFGARGRWYKGALHVHTTRSDGRLEPAQAVRAHREAEYNFLAAADHRTITDLSSWNQSGFLTIRSVEVDYGSNAVGQRCHLIALCVRNLADVQRDSPLQDAIARWAETGALLILAHPYWSGMDVQEIVRLAHLARLEMYNTGSQVDLGKGLSSVHWDGVFGRDKRWLGYAVDDAHWVRLNGRPRDAFGAWVWVKAERLSESAILESRARGYFYSSTGPRIYDFRVRDGVAEVRCSQVAGIRFASHTQWGSHCRGPHGAADSEAEYVLTGNERHLGVECVDFQGRTAWTDPVFL